jgi:ubiquinone/menaquinone biosynthesis C-methylase UbiE
MSDHEPSRANWTRVDETSDPRWFIRMLDATRSRLLRAATADPRAFFGYLDLLPGLAVLDVGCGTGDFDRLIASLVGPTGRVLGVDYGPTMVDEAVTRSAGLALPVEFRQADAHQLPIPDGTFDRCLATQVFQHLPRPSRALAEMVRVARSGGRVIVTEPDWDSRVSSLGDLTLSRAVTRAWAEKITNPAIARELPSMFVEAGLVNVRLDVTPYVMSANEPAMALDLVAQPLRDLAGTGALDPERLGRTLSLVESRIAAGTWVDLALMLRVTGEKRG